MKEVLKSLIYIISVFIGLVALVKIIKNIELISAVISLTFGITALIWTFKSYSSLSKGSSLRKYTAYFLFCLVSIMVFSVWHTLIKLFNWSGFLLYLQYIFITLSYLIFVLAAYQVLYLGKEFGFEKETRKIKKLIKKK